MEISVLSSCLLAFLVVFILLAFLALVIRLITAVFPEKTVAPDAALVAAIHAAASIRFPGARVTRIEEVRK